MTWLTLIKGVVIQAMRRCRDLMVRPWIRFLSRSRFVGARVRRRAASALGVSSSESVWLDAGVGFLAPNVELGRRVRVGEGVVFTGLAAIRVADGADIPAGTRLGHVMTSDGGTGLEIHLPSRYEGGDATSVDPGNEG